MAAEGALVVEAFVALVALIRLAARVLKDVRVELTLRREHLETTKSGLVK